MSITDNYQTAGSWLDCSGPMSDVVISSRIRLARNVVGFRFYAHSDDAERSDLQEYVHQRLMKTSLKDDLHYLDMGSTPKLERQVLAERHVISQQLASDGPCRAVAVSQDESLALMINEEDHLRVQVLASGQQLAEEYDRINRVDSILEKEIDFAFSPEFGYLTACPTNVGTGLRVSAMLHLPALKMTSQMEKVFSAAKAMKLAVRGLYGEGSEPIGDLYQFSNQTTLGKSEKQIVEEMVNLAIEPIVKYERTARQHLIEQRCAALDDKIFRALGLLRNARMISSEESLYMLSFARLGVHLGRIKDVTLDRINMLMQLTRPAHLQHLQQRELEPEERDIVRAEFIRKTLN
ncbi:MAG: protein arginine kinase [Sedimentisphaerales bacterium]|nr:protein arginine kinase [Sedimentisphaerales bacterium]